MPGLQMLPAGMPPAHAGMAPAHAGMAPAHAGEGMWGNGRGPRQDVMRILMDGQASVC